MKSALIAAIVAAVVASGTTYAATKINGSAISVHSIPTNRLAAGVAKNIKAARQLASVVSSTLVQQSNAVSTTDWTRSPETVEADCPSGYGAVGGGYALGGDWSTNVTSTGLTANGTGWIVESIGASGNGPGTTFTVEVTCEPS